MTTAHQFDHIPNQFKTPPEDMPSLFTLTTAPSYTSILDFQKAPNHLLKTDKKESWQNTCSKEFRRLTDGQSKDATPSTNTFEWINRHHIPRNKKSTYIRICVNYRPQKADPYQVRCTLGVIFTTTIISSLRQPPSYSSDQIHKKNQKICKSPL